jgi:hypothetical protein
MKLGTSQPSQTFPVANGFEHKIQISHRHKYVVQYGTYDESNIEKVSNDTIFMQG